jgi:hypothetical protein
MKKETELGNMKRKKEKKDMEKNTKHSAIL